VTREGVALRMPAASTEPSTELSASLRSTSSDGRPLRVRPSTSSSSLGGATLTSRRLARRSMISASAAMEHRIKGQIGHPAACMIENKEIPRAQAGTLATGCLKTADAIMAAGAAAVFGGGAGRRAGIGAGAVSTSSTGPKNPIHPHFLWITLWATRYGRTQGPVRTRVSVDCCFFAHGNIFINQ